MAVRHFSHVGLCVTDLRRSQIFYEALGLRVIHRVNIAAGLADELLGLPGATFEAVFLEGYGVRLELLRFEAPIYDGLRNEPALNRPGLTHLSFRVVDLDASLAMLQPLGARVLSQVRRDTERAAAFVLDPDGTQLELYQSPGPDGKLPGT